MVNPRDIAGERKKQKQQQKQQKKKKRECLKPVSGRVFLIYADGDTINKRVGLYETYRTTAVGKAGSLAQWLRRPPRERKIRGLNPTLCVESYP